MITLRPGSHTYRILSLLAAAGEFPTGSLQLLGSGRSLDALVSRLEKPQQFRTENGTELGTYKLLTVSGKRELRTIRLYRRALPLLKEIHPAAQEQYLTLTNGHRFSGSNSHIQRNHRVAETLAMCLGAGIEFQPYALPPLQKEYIVRSVPATPSFYIAKSIKRLDHAEMNKTIYTRLTGALFTEDTCFAVYNARNAAMKWSGMGEYKAARHLEELARMNAGLPGAEHALLFGGNMDVALRTIRESEKRQSREVRFDAIFPHIHFVPMNDAGVRLLKILTFPNWHEAILEAAFPREWRCDLPVSLECDAKHQGKYILSHLDGDLARVLRLQQSMGLHNLPYEILCFPWQSPFLHAYFGSRVELREVGMDLLESILGICCQTVRAERRTDDMR